MRTSQLLDKWDYNPSWLKYVERVWSGVGRVELVNDDSEERLAFLQRAKEAFSARSIPFKQVKTWVSIQEPKSGEGYDEGYPHVHYPLTGHTLVHYLQPGDKPAPLHIYENEDDFVEIYPEAGMTVFMPNNVKHGVLKNNGTTNRIQMIASAI